MDVDKPSLRQYLTEYFDIDDLETLCFDMGIDHEKFTNQGKGRMVRELITYTDRSGRIEELLTHCRKLRSNVDWDSVIQTIQPEPVQTEQLQSPKELLAQYMDADELREEIAHQRGLQKHHRKRLRALERQVAMLGRAKVPFYVLQDIKKIDEEVQSCEHKVMTCRNMLVKLKREEMERLEAKIAPTVEYIKHFLASEHPPVMMIFEYDEWIKPDRDKIESLRREISEIENL